MPYQRKELYYIKNFNFKAHDPKRKSASDPEHKFLIVIDNKGNENGIYCLTTSLSGRISSLIIPKLTSDCMEVDEGHFFTFSDINICQDFSFEKTTFIRATPSDVFQENVATLVQMYDMPKLSKKMGVLRDDIFICMLSCLCKSDYLERNLIQKIHSVAEEILKK